MSKPDETPARSASLLHPKLVAQVRSAIVQSGLAFADMPLSEIRQALSDPPRTAGGVVILNAREKVWRAMDIELVDAAASFAARVRAATREQR